MPCSASQEPGKPTRKTGVSRCSWIGHGLAFDKLLQVGQQGDAFKLPVAELLVDSAVFLLDSIHSRDRSSELGQQI
jgi:hypothetical protein